MLNVSTKPYLITITSRKQVAQIRGKGVYVVSGVAIIPITSRSEAESAIALTKKSPKAKSDGTNLAEEDNSDTTVEDLESGNFSADEDDVLPDHPEEPSLGDSDSSVAKDVIGRKGKYGRVAERWFSRKGWAADKRRVSVSISENKASAKGLVEVKNVPRSKTDSIALSLLPKLLRTTKILLSSRSFYFAYDLDLTRRLGQDQSMDSDLPLHKKVDEMARRPLQAQRLR